MCLIQRQNQPLMEVRWRYKQNRYVLFSSLKSFKCLGQSS